jgi:hypothetical protein
MTNRPLPAIALRQSSPLDRTSVNTQIDCGWRTAFLFDATKKTLPIPPSFDLEHLTAPRVCPQQPIGKRADKEIML